MNRNLKEAYKRVLKSKIINENSQLLNEGTGGLIGRLLRQAYGRRYPSLDRYFPGRPQSDWMANTEEGGRLLRIWRNTARSLNTMIPRNMSRSLYDSLREQFPKFYRVLPEHEIIDTLVTPGNSNIIIIKTRDGGYIYQYIDGNGMRILDGTKIPRPEPDGSYIFPDGFFQNNDNFIRDLDGQFPPTDMEKYKQLFGTIGIVLGGAFAYDATADDESDDIIAEPPPAPVEQTPEFLTRPGREWHPPMK